MVLSPYGYTDFFNIIAGVMQGDTLAPYIFLICLDYILWTLIDLMKENGFTLKKARCRWHLAETITDADELAHFTNTSGQAEFLLYSLEALASVWTRLFSLTHHLISPKPNW